MLIFSGLSVRLSYTSCSFLLLASNSHWSYWDNLLRKEDKFRPVSCISFLCAKRGRKNEIALKYLKEEKGNLFFSPLLCKMIFFFFHFIFFPQESSASQSLAALSSHCTGRNGYGLYTCRSLDFEQTV